MEYLFIGDVFLPDLGIWPVYAPVGGKRVTYEEVKKYLRVIDKLESYYTYDGAQIYYRVYKDTVYVGSTVSVIQVEKMVEEAERVTGSLCDFLKKVSLIDYVYSKKAYSVVPVIVKYPSFWEHLSTAPIKAVKDSTATYHLYRGSIGIIVLDRDIPVHRPYLKDVMEKPTTQLLDRECNLGLEKKETEEVKVTNPLI